MRVSLLLNEFAFLGEIARLAAGRDLLAVLSLADDFRLVAGTFADRARLMAAVFFVELCFALAFAPAFFATFFTLARGLGFRLAPPAVSLEDVFPLNRSHSC